MAHLTQLFNYVDEHQDVYVQVKWRSNFLYNVTADCVNSQMDCSWFGEFLTSVLVSQRLAEWVAVQSVSAWPEKRGEIKKMMEMAAKDIERLGGTVELVDIGTQTVSEYNIVFV